MFLDSGENVGAANKCPKVRTSSYFCFAKKTYFKIGEYTVVFTACAPTA
jgi:L-asparaginase/Glu-tRNA(Gln) amidotransferase subunit D